MFVGIDLLYIAAGFAACWYGKDKIQKWWQGAATFATNLEAKATAVRAAVTTPAAPSSATTPAPK